jgi:hypothetical protein
MGYLRWSHRKDDLGKIYIYIFLGKNEHSKKEIASLTKIMTFLVTIQMIEKLKIDPKKTFI